MKNLTNIFQLFLLFLFGVVWAAGVSAQEDGRIILLRVEGPQSTVIRQDISVPEACEVLDGDGEAHTFEGFVALCALQQAKDEGIIDGYSGTVGEFGFFLESVNGVENEPWPGSFWIFRVNDAVAQVGLSSYEVAEEDRILLTYGPWPMEPLALGGPSSAEKDEEISFEISLWNDDQGSFVPYSGSATLSVDGIAFSVTPSVDGILSWIFSEIGTKEVHAEAANKTRSDVLSVLVGETASEEEDGSEEENQEEENSNGNGGGGGGNGNGNSQEEVSLEDALASAVVYLKAQDNNAAKTMALVAAGEDADVSYLTSFSADSAIAYAKPILAVAAAGKDPKTFPDEDFVAKIKGFTKDAQFGEPGLLNDDIWGILALISAGVSPEDSVIQNSKAFLLENQNEDGGWTWGVGQSSETDMTAVAVAALLEAGVSKSDDRIVNAVAYVKGNQKENGGFMMMSEEDCAADWCSTPNTDTTAWVVIMINKLEEDPQSSTWTTEAGKDPIQFLISLQDEDGSFWSATQGGNKMFSPADAVIALSGKSFPVKIFVPAPVSSSGGSGGGVVVLSPPVPQSPAIPKEAVFAAPMKFGDVEVFGVVRIPEGTEFESDWDGTLEVMITENQESLGQLLGATEEGVNVSDLNPVGFLRADTGLESKLVFNAPIFVSIPVFAEDGEELFVYVRSGQEDFFYLQTCTVSANMCTVSLEHLSEFVAVRTHAQQYLENVLGQKQVELELERLRAEVALLQTQMQELLAEKAERERRQELAEPLISQDIPENSGEDRQVVVQLLKDVDIAGFQGASAEEASRGILEEYRQELFVLLVALGLALLALHAVLMLRARRKTIIMTPSQVRAFQALQGQ